MWCRCFFILVISQVFLHVVEVYILVTSQVYVHEIPPCTATENAQGRKEIPVMHSFEREQALYSIQPKKNQASTSPWACVGIKYNCHEKGYRLLPPPVPSPFTNTGKHTHTHTGIDEAPPHTRTSIHSHIT
jgi:hypothetical protein